MTWVLILNSDINGKPPAVIGGYPTREEAEAAGELATAFKNVEKADETGWYNTVRPFYMSYIVIPGAADGSAVGATHSTVYHSDPYGKLERKTERW